MTKYSEIESGFKKTWKSTFVPVLNWC